MSTIKTLAVKGLKNFFTLKPKRDYSITQNRAIFGALFVVLTQITDFTTTVTGLELGATEQNALMATAITAAGYPGFFSLKLLSGLFLAWFSWKRRYAPWVIGGLYTAVSLWNSVVIYLHA
jgi:hypothetical protein